MTQVLAALARRFRFNEQLLKVATEGFGPEDWARPPAPSGGNCAHWILGHVTQSRRMALRRLGVELAREPWEELVGMHSKPVGTAGFPPVAALQGEFSARGAELARLLAELGQGEAEAAWGGKPFPDGSRSVNDVLHFLYFHETYHLGQIGLLRRIAGKPGFV